MPELTFSLVDEATFDEIPDPARPGARCRTCDYWERIDGGRDAPEADAPDAVQRANLKRQRLLAGRAAAGSYAMLRFSLDTADPERGALMQKARELGAAIETTLLFFELEWNLVPDERADELLAGERHARD